jgi:ribosomal protein S18 acetylase RimI-like enzyme
MTGPYPGYSLRAARPTDAVDVAQLVDDAYRHYLRRLGGRPGPMREDYARVIRDRDVTVAEGGAGIVGVIAVGVTEEGFTIDNVAVLPSRQGEGIGRALLEFAEEQARRRGFDSVHLYTHEKMAENRALYARIGYVEYARRRDGPFSRVLMRKWLR